MANYAVRIYDPALKAWLIAEAARRGPGVRTSDVVESSLQLLKASLGGSDAPVEDIPAPPAESVRGGDASDRAAAPADAVSRETVVPPVPAVDPADRVAYETPLVLNRILDIVAPVSRVKGPDSGPDAELGF